MHRLLAARVAVGLERRRGRSCRRYYLYPFGVAASGREVAPPGLLSSRPALSPSAAGGAAITNSVIAYCVTRRHSGAVSPQWLGCTAALWLGSPRLGLNRGQLGGRTYW